jgi:putrescine aminotransferase
MFACEHEGIEPDLLTLAKALGGGVMPIGATLGTAKIWEAIYGENPLLHSSTFGGNPLACAAGLAAINATLEGGLIERGRVLGDRIMAGLNQLKAEQPDMIAEVRGMGMMIGVEFAMDEVGELVIAQMTKRGVIAAYTLNNPRVIRIEPPLIMTDEQADFAVKVFGEAVAETAEILSMLA